MEAKVLYQVNIYDKLYVPILAYSKYHAIDQMYYTCCGRFPDRKKYSAKIKKV